MDEETRVHDAKTDKEKPTVFMKKNIKLVEWTNKNKDGREFKSVQLRRSYKDSEDEWKESDSFSITDLSLIEEVIGEYKRVISPLKKL